MIYRLTALLVLTLLSVFSLHASDLIHSRTSSYYKYIYKLNPKEARKIYKKGLTEVDENFFHHLVDSVPNDSVFNTKLPQGNYLLVWAQENELKFELRSYSDLEIMVHNNYADLLITISDTAGLEIKNAKVKVNGTPVRYKPELAAYQKHNVNKRGWLEVTYNGFTGYHYVGNSVKKGVKFRKVVSSVPIKYVYVPARIIAFLPYDLVRTVYKRRPYGAFYYAYKPFKDIYLSIFRYGTHGWINRLVRKWEDMMYKDYEGYMVYSKPKYKPNDTIRFKAFVTSEDGKPLRAQPLAVVLRQTNNKKIKLDTIFPNRKGSYDYEFVLHDTLGLRLDCNYTINLEKANWSKRVISGRFRYEDYELNNITYKMRTDAMEQLNGQPFYIHVKGEDMNGLNVPDGRVEVNLLSNKSFSNIYTKCEFLPDTLHTIRQSLDPVGETSILIPDSVLPKMDFDYTLEAIFRTSDNERVQKTKRVYYYYQKEEIDLSVVNDSLYLVYTSLGKEKALRGQLFVYDKNKNLMETRSVQLPCRYPVNYQASYYEFKSSKLNRYFNMEDYKPNLSVSSNRTSRKAQIVINNPNGIWFNYFVYKKDQEIASGYNQKLDTILNVGNTKGCYVSLNYKWAGKPYSQSVTIPLYKKQLNVKINQPQVIYPGQTAEISVEVTDFKDRPVKDVDLTVYGMTKKFGYNAPQLNYFGKGHKPRTMFNNYSLQGDKLFGSKGQRVLNYTKWNPLMKLDTISYYRFTRPEDGIETEYITAEDSVTQFAPFVCINGIQQKVHFIYLDYELIYSSITNNNDPYSFRCRHGLHKLNIRTSTQDITLDSVYFRHGLKTLVSVDTYKSNKNIEVQERKPTLTKTEKQYINNKFARFDVSENYGIVYLQQGNRKYFLKNSTVSNRPYYNGSVNDITVGPFKRGTVYFVTKDKCKVPFHFEGSYKYWINGNRTKMKSWQNFWGYRYKQLNKFGEVESFNDQAWTTSAFDRMGKKQYKERVLGNIIYDNPWTTTKGAGTIGLVYNKNSEKTTYLAQILLFKDDEPNYMQIFPGSATRMFNLKPGSYRLLFFMDDGSYFEKKTISVKPNVISGLNIVEPDSLLYDEMSGTITQLLKTKWVNNSYRKKDYREKWKAERKIKAAYQKSKLDFSNSRIITGQVTDDETGDPIIGANVMIDGTSIGTISDFDGNYSIEVPAGEWKLNFSFIGYNTYDVPLSYSNIVNVGLNASTCDIDEVVVVGYGSQAKEVLTMACTSVSTEIIAGRLSGVDVVTGGTSGFIIRGVSADKATGEPLYIIDGVPVEASAKDIDESLIANIDVMQASSAVAIYGSRAANGVVLIATKGGKGIPGLKTIANNQEVPQQVNSYSSLRSNFSDEAYWQPNLVTNNKGKASFITTFPDDITSWSTFALAMGNKATGQVQSEVKSFKPVSAQLMAPRFLVEGDSIAAIGKMINYLGDSIQVTSSFKVDSAEVFTRKNKIGRIQVDSLSFIANSTDTIALTYSLERDNGYFDGEKREVPVFRRGVEEVEGAFFTLNTDSVITIKLPKGCEKGELYMESNPLNIILNEAKHLRNYEHLCNEQASSKLLSLLNEEKICKYLGKKFKYKDDVNKLIKRLQDSKNEKGLWGWWKNMNTQWWITPRVVEALERAKITGYKVDYNQESVKYGLVNQYHEYDSHVQLNIIKSLHMMKAQVNLKHMVEEFNDSVINRIDSLKLTIIKQELDMPVDIEPLLQRKQETLFGNYFWGTPCWSLFYGDIRETLLMYQIVKNSGEHKEWLPKIRNYFYERRGKSGWRNTYESAMIIDVLVPDLLSKDNSNGTSTMKVDIDGKETDISSYPFKKNFTNAKEITITKSGDQVVFAGWHSRYFNQQPERKGDHFEIKTSFERNGDKTDSLVAGQKVSLVVEVDVKKNSNYLMLEIPVPSVCSYHNKPQTWWGGQHREYFKDRVAIYYENLKAGKLKVNIELVPRYTGKVALNPARMEQMYFPVFYGNNKLKEIKVLSE